MTKKILLPIICFLLVVLLTIYVNKISDFITSKITPIRSLEISEANEYAKKNDFAYIKINKTYTPYSYKDLIDIVYTVINNGWDTFSFYCPSEYSECLNDMERLSKDELSLTHINNFVHPFNSFTVLNVSIVESGEITIKVSHLYSDKQIKEINNEVDRIMNLIVKDTNSTYDNIKAIHDYIIQNTKYNEDKDSDGNSLYSTAFNTLFDHLSTCNGYTDTMAIFLSKLNIKNYKIATTKDDISYSNTGHIWNAVYLDDKWYHLDLTWDDPVTNTGQDYLYHKYFMITTEELNKADSGEVKVEEHNFNKKVYLEFNEKYQELS